MVMLLVFPSVVAVQVQLQPLDPFDRCSRNEGKTATPRMGCVIPVMAANPLTQVIEINLVIQ